MNFSNISILVPYTSDKGEREKNWMWLKKRYDLLMPEAELVIGDCDNFPYSRSEAINNAAKKATKDIFIITDADIIFDIKDIELCISLLSRYKFVLPYSRFLKLNKQITQTILSLPQDLIMSTLHLTKREYTVLFDIVEPCALRNCFGGICVIRKEHFIECGGFDERFRGWGGEDDAFFSMIKYLYKDYTRANNITMYHLFHNPQPKIHNCYTSNLSLLNNEYYNVRNISKTLEYLKTQNSFYLK